MGRFAIADHALRPDVFRITIAKRGIFARMRANGTQVVQVAAMTDRFVVWVPPRAKAPDIFAVALRELWRVNVLPVALANFTQMALVFR